MCEVLIVDDERAIRTALSRQLTAAGYSVRVAASGESGIAAFAERRPDIVLLDVMMPRMSGYEACCEMRKLDRETPIVFLSALDSEQNQILGLRSGADDFVSKTASAELLLARLNKAIERADRFSKADAPASMTKTEADIYRLLDSDRGRSRSATNFLGSISSIIRSSRLPPKVLPDASPKSTARNMVLLRA